MISHTVYRTFNTSRRREFIRITEDVDDAVREGGIAEGMAIVCAMHITAGVWINDDEPGLQEDTLEWLDKLAPPSRKEPANDVARELSPDPGDYRHHAGGEDNGDAHLKNLLVHHQVIVPVTDGRLAWVRGSRSSTASSTAAGPSGSSSKSSASSPAAPVPAEGRSGRVPSGQTRARCQRLHGSLPSSRNGFDPRRPLFPATA